MIALSSQASAVVRRSAAAALGVGVLLIVLALYWPAHRAGFIWVDTSLVEFGWLRSDDWPRYIFQNFFDWTNYFRPLGVALLVLEERLFNVSSGPMHLVSLGLHLANVALVGVIAARANGVRQRHSLLVPLAMLLYGLHPALIEPVVWISCQFDLLATLFMLAGLACNLALHNKALRAGTVAACFLLAACSKESAAVFPALLFLMDAMSVQLSVPQTDRCTQLREVLRAQAQVYAAVLIAGIGYLMLRGSSMDLLPVTGSNVSPIAHFQTVCWLLLTYLRIIVWPMIDLSPVHEIDMRMFSESSALMLANDAAALAVLVLAGILLWKRKPAGFLFAAAMAALLPVLHIAPVEFDSSLYHERYAMMAIAMICALLPCTLSGKGGGWPWVRKIMLPAISCFWIAIAIANIVVTLPLWSDEARLWSWVLRKHPESVLARNHLLSTWLERGDMEHARPLAAELFTRGKWCPVCLVNVANVALADGETVAARRALDRAAPLLRRANQPRLSEAHALASGRLQELQGDSVQAEGFYRLAIGLEPSDPRPHMRLALLLAVAGRIDEAQVHARTAFGLFAPWERPIQQRLFESVVAGVEQEGTAGPRP